MQDDPPVPPDGSCVNCGGERRLSGLKPLYRAAAEDDPFCSTECCRAWYGISLPYTKVGARRA